MKKYLKLLCVFSIAILATGCVKINVTMKVNADKSMDIEFVEAMADSLLKTKGEDSILSKTEITKMEKDGYTIKKYSKDKMTGYTVTKKISNIDDISDTKEVKGDLSLKKSGEKLFTVKKGFFKNTYTAKLKSSDSSSVSNQMNTNTTTDKDEDEEEDNTSSSLTDATNALGDYSNAMSSMDMSFKITLPDKPISNNASEVSKDGKTLTWNLLEGKDSIDFEFSLYNMTNIIIVAVAGVVVIAGAVVLIVVVTKKKKPQTKSKDEKKKTTK